MDLCVLIQHRRMQFMTDTRHYLKRDHHELNRSLQCGATRTVVMMTEGRSFQGY